MQNRRGIILFTDPGRSAVGNVNVRANNLARPGDQIDAVDGRRIRFVEDFDPTVRAARRFLGQVRSNKFWAHRFAFRVEISF